MSNRVEVLRNATVKLEGVDVDADGVELYPGWVKVQYFDANGVETEKWYPSEKVKHVEDNI